MNSVGSSTTGGGHHDSWHGEFGHGMDLAYPGTMPPLQAGHGMVIAWIWHILHHATTAGRSWHGHGMNLTYPARCPPVVSLLTTSMLWRDISMLTSTEKYSVMDGEPSWGGGGAGAGAGEGEGEGEGSSSLGPLVDALEGGGD